VHSFKLAHRNNKSWWFFEELKYQSNKKRYTKRER